MKPLIFLTALASLTAPAIAQGITAPAKVTPIRMEVRQNTKGKSVAKPNAPHSQSQSLTINLQNNSNESFTDLVVKYWFFTRDMKGSEVSVLKQAEKPGTLSPRGRGSFETETVSSTYTREHTELEHGNGQPNNQRGNVAVKRIPASGKKIVGYAVKVLNGGSVVAEYYSEPSFKAMTGAN